MTSRLKTVPVAVCPTKTIDFLQDESSRTIWGRRFELVLCQCFGEILGIREELALAAQKAGEPEEKICAGCRKKAIAEVIAHTYGVE